MLLSADVSASTCYKIAAWRVQTSCRLWLWSEALRCDTDITWNSYNGGDNDKRPHDHWLYPHRYDPSWPHISQDPLCVRKRRKKERKWRHHVVYIVKHLVTQPGNAPKARPSHLTTADEVNKVSLKDSPSKTTEAESFRGRRPELTHSRCFPYSPATVG